MNKPISERVIFDDANHLVIVDGIKISEELFVAFTEPTRYGLWFRIIEKKDGVVTIEQRQFETLQ